MGLPRIIANWKMNGSSKLIHNWVSTAGEKIPHKYQNVCLFCPPVCYLSQASSLLEEQELNFILGAQNVDADTENTLTGGISASMLEDLKCKYIIVGHSERRIFLQEEEETLHKKLKTAVSKKLGIIYCVGETSLEKDQGKASTVILNQLNLLKKIESDSLVIAYEPVWAIGSGKYASPEYIKEMHSVIKEELNSIERRNVDIPVAYGGSIDVSNVKSIINVSNVDGLLIGGASLDAEEFAKIARISLDY